jgi:hypothetical protein
MSAEGALPALPTPPLTQAWRKLAQERPCHH